MRLFFICFLIVRLFGEDSFITQDEYAKMLYQSPRGVGCHKCHGLDGKGMVLGRYRDGNRTVVIRAPDITKLSFFRFKQALQTSKNRLMPHYFLTEKEIKALYYYLQRHAKRKR